MSEILLYPGPITIPAGDSGNEFAQIQVVNSSGTPPSNGPDLFFTELLFDGATDEHVVFGFRMPADYSSGGTLKVQWKRASGTGAANVVVKAAVAAITPGAAEVPNSKSFNTVATTTTAAGTTAQAVVESDITLTMDSAAAGDMVWIMLGRDADNGADTLNSVDIQVVSVIFSYTAA